MGSVAIKASPAVGRLLRQRRKELGLTLKEVSARIEKQGEKLPVSTLTRVEQGKLDPGLRRLYLLLRLYQVPVHMVPDLLELEELAAEEPVGKDLPTLFRDGLAEWKKGNVGDALAHLFAIRYSVPADEESRSLRQEATLSFAVAARELGRLALARQLVDDLLCEPPADELLAKILILSSTLWSAQGSCAMGLATIRQAALHLVPGDDRQRAWMLHQEARLLIETGEPGEAEPILEQAMKLYRVVSDAHGETKALITRIGVLDAQGDPDGARSCADQALEIAKEHEYGLLEMAARIEIGRLLVNSGSAEEGVKQLRTALSKAVLLDDTIAEFHAHYQLWKAYEAVGEEDRMKFAFQSAAFLVQSIDALSPEAKEICKEVEKLGRKRSRRRPGLRG
jgi:tetratricopeptide (TPR) repeat protein